MQKKYHLCFLQSRPTLKLGVLYLEIEMTSRKRFTHESQDARRHDQHNATHKTEKHQEKRSRPDKRK